MYEQVRELVERRRNLRTTHPEKVLELFSAERDRSAIIVGDEDGAVDHPHLRAAIAIAAEVERSDHRIGTARNTLRTLSLSRHVVCLSGCIYTRL